MHKAAGVNIFLIVVLIACCLAPWNCVLTFEEPCEDLSDCDVCQEKADYDYVCHQLRGKLWFVVVEMMLSGVLDLICAGACLWIYRNMAELERKPLLEVPSA